MKRRMMLLGVAALLGVSLNSDVLACGDKFLMSSRGTRYHRPKNFRAASILIYADPAAGLNRSKLESILKSEGHRSTAAQSVEQLSALLAGGRYDVVLTATTVAPTVEQLVAKGPDQAIIVALESKPKNDSVLKAIDRAVEKRDQNLKKLQIRS